MRHNIVGRLGEDVGVYSELEEMIAAFPGLDDSRATADISRPDRADVLVKARLPRRQAARAAGTAARWWARVASWIAVFGVWLVWNHFAVESGFDISAYPAFDTVMALPRSLHRLGMMLGNPAWMLAGLLPVLVVAAFYAAAATRSKAMWLVSPAEGLVQVTVAAVIAAAIFGQPSIASAPVTWVAAAVGTAAAVRRGW